MMKQYFVLLGIMVGCAPFFLVYGVITMVKKLLRGLIFALMNDSDKALDSIKDVME